MKHKIRVMEFFSGYGSTAMAMKRLQKDFPDKIEFEFVGISEIEPNAIKAYNVVHGEVKNFGDICKINPDEIPDFDLGTWSFPCTDISNAGKQAGLSNDSGTRSSLCWDAMRIFKVKKPKYLLMENVKALVSQKFMPDFKRLMDELADMGYSNFWQVMNAKDYSCPQNRERVFMVSILNADGFFHFPEPFKLEKRLKDVLEENVDEKYYLKDSQVQRIVEHCDRKVAEGCGFKPGFTDGGGYLTQSLQDMDKEKPIPISEPKIEVMATLNKSQDGKILSPNGIAKAHCAGHFNQPKILLDE